MTRTTIALAAVFLAAITAANLITNTYGPTASIYTALGLVALDLVLRDAIHDRATPRERVAIIAVLVLAGSAISYTVGAQAVAVASAVAFAASLTIDTLVYQAVHRAPWLERSSASNIAAAIVDSALFVAIAFPGFLFNVAALQAGMKIAGGLLFALLFDRYAFRRRRTAPEAA